MTPAQLSTALVEVLEALRRDGELRLPDGVPSAVDVRRPAHAGRSNHGDWATGVAFPLAAREVRDPRRLAELLGARLEEYDGVAGVEVAGAGFLNISVHPRALGAVAAQVLGAGAAYGHSAGPAPRGIVAGDPSVQHVRYAHAQTCCLLRNGCDLGLEPGDRLEPTHDREVRLLRMLAEFPGAAASTVAPDRTDRLLRHLDETASAYDRFFDACPVLPVGDEEPGEPHRSRLLLVAASRTVLANGLGMLGLDAPVRM